MGWAELDGSNAWHAHWIVRNIFPTVTVLIDANLTRAFVSRYDAKMWRAFIDSLILNAGFAGAYLLGGMSTRDFILLLSLVSFRVTGSYVLYTIVNKPFPGIDRSLYAWIVLLSAATAAPLIPFTVPVVGWSLTVQYVLPWICMAQITVTNVLDLAANYATIKRL